MQPLGHLKRATIPKLRLRSVLSGTLYVNKTRQGLLAHAMSACPYCHTINGCMRSSLNVVFVLREFRGAEWKILEKWINDIIMFVPGSFKTKL